MGFGGGIRTAAAKARRCCVVMVLMACGSVVCKTLHSATFLFLPNNRYTHTHTHMLKRTESVPRQLFSLRHARDTRSTVARISAIGTYPAATLLFSPGGLRLVDWDGWLVLG